MIRKEITGSEQETREEVDEPVMPAPGKMVVYILEKLFFSNSQV